MARLLPRKRTVLGATLTVGLVTGIWLSGKLPHTGTGFGLGTGGDSVLGQPDPSNSVSKDLVDAAKPDGVTQFAVAAAAQPQLEVLLPDHALGDDLKAVAKQGCFEALAPDLLVQ